MSSTTTYSLIGAAGGIRNRIKGPDGIQWLTVPVLKRGRYTQLIRDTRIDGTSAWQRKHLAALRADYGRAPYFESYYPELARVIARDWSFLIDLDLELIRLLLNFLGFQRPMRLASSLGIDGRATDRLAAICCSLGASEYLSGDAAQDYLDPDLFHAVGIRVRYQHYSHPEYTQLFGPFISHLSVVDLLFNHGPESGEILTNRSTASCPSAHAMNSCPAYLEQEDQ